MTPEEKAQIEAQIVARVARLDQHAAAMRRFLDGRAEQVAAARRDGLDDHFIAAQLIGGLKNDPQWGRDDMIFMAVMALMMLPQSSPGTEKEE